MLLNEGYVIHFSLLSSLCDHSYISSLLLSSQGVEANIEYWCSQCITWKHNTTELVKLRDDLHEHYTQEQADASKSILMGVSDQQKKAKELFIRLLKVGVGCVDGWVVVVVLLLYKLLFFKQQPVNYIIFLNICTDIISSCGHINLHIIYIIPPPRSYHVYHHHHLPLSSSFIL